MWKLTLDFGSVPVLEVGPLVNKILDRGWRAVNPAITNHPPHEVSFVRELGGDEQFKRELEEIRSLFGPYWRPGRHGEVSDPPRF